MPKATADENSAALSADLRASALFDVRGKVVVVSGGGAQYYNRGYHVGRGATAPRAPDARAIARRGPKCGLYSW